MDIRYIACFFLFNASPWNSDLKKVSANEKSAIFLVVGDENRFHLSINNKENIMLAYWLNVCRQKIIFLLMTIHIQAARVKKKCLEINKQKNNDKTYLINGGVHLKPGISWPFKGVSMGYLLLKWVSLDFLSGQETKYFIEKKVLSLHKVK